MSGAIVGWSEAGWSEAFVGWPGAGVGLASGATTSLASDYILGRRALFLMIAPSILPALAMRTTLGAGELMHALLAVERMR